MAGFKTKVTPEIENLTDICKEHTSLDLSLYGKYDVKRGLRDINGKGVLAGLTQVSNIVSSKTIDGKRKPQRLLMAKKFHVLEVFPTEDMISKILPGDLSKMTDMDLKK